MHTEASAARNGMHCSRFTTTHWTVVIAAGQSGNAEAKHALQALCTRYWYPLYAYIRRRGYDAHEAQDLTQEFISRLLERHYLRDLHPSKGKFRSFLIASLNHFLAKEWRRARRQKRGGNCLTLSLDAEEAEDRYRIELVDDCTPEKLYERGWATAVLDRAMKQLRQESLDADKLELFEQLKGMLAGEPLDVEYAEVGKGLAMTESAVKKAAQRLRDRYRELLREEVAATVDVATNEAVDDELRYLISVML